VLIAPEVTDTFTKIRNSFCCFMLLDLYFQLKNQFQIQVDFFWVVTPCSVVVGYQRFGGPCCLHLQGEVISYHNAARCHNP
jgi:hypothetical protein